MKHKVLLLATLFFGVSISVYSQTDTTLKKLLLINYTAYKGHTVDSLIKALPANYTKMSIAASHRGEYGNILVVHYANKISVGIKVKTFKYFNPWLDFTKPLPNQWDANIPLFKKEAIAYCIVTQGPTCYAGCESDPKSQWERKIKH